VELCTTDPATRLDLGLDPSSFTTQYQVSDEVAPVYQVLPTALGSSPFNDATTPQLVPCGIQNFDVQVLVSSAAGSPPLYPQVAVRLYTSAGEPITSSASGTTISAVVAELSRLGPGASSTAQVTGRPRGVPG
jgi:hypothetical protein